jgi:hypothetical protein
MATIEELMKRHCDRAEGQPIRWARPSWEAVWTDTDLPGSGVLDAVDDEVDALGRGTIRRSWVRTLADGDPGVFQSPRSFSPRDAPRLRDFPHSSPEDAPAFDH